MVRAVATNNKEPGVTVRKRQCADCGFVWFTVELPVSPAVVGWGRIDANGKGTAVLGV